MLSIILRQFVFVIFGFAFITSLNADDSFFDDDVFDDSDVFVAVTQVILMTLMTLMTLGSLYESF